MSTDPFSALVAAVRGSRIELTAEDWADAIWLAEQVPAVGRAAPAPTAPRSSPARAPVEEATEVRLPPTAPTAPEPAAPPRPRPDGHRFDIYVDRPDLELPMPARPLLAPAPPVLPESLVIVRALRPLIRRSASRRRRRLDAEATARRLADEGIWEPVLLPEMERTVSLTLVLDVGSSMDVWRPTLAAIQRLLGQLGGFLRVRTLAMETDALEPALRPVRQRHRRGTDLVLAQPCSPGSIVEPGGPQVILLVSDAVSRAWHSGAVARLLAAWSHAAPTALVQILPERLWSRTALRDARPIRFLSRGTALGRRGSWAPVEQLGPSEEEDAPTVAVPVATLDPSSLRDLAGLLAGRGMVRGAGLLLSVPDPGDAFQVPAAAAPGPEEVVETFRRSASRVARRLAALLAAAPAINLPVIRLVGEAMMPGTCHRIHQAEVWLGGLLEPAPGNDPAAPPEEVFYTFRPGVRDHLLDALPRPDAVEVLAGVSGYVEANLGQLAVLKSLLADPAARAGSLVIDHPIARVAAQVLARLGGDYARLVATDAPSPPAVVRILHISDLQISEKHTPQDEPMLSALIPPLRDLVARGLGPDLVVITGDIAFSGLASEFAMARDWITGTLLPALGGLGPDRVVVVSGNHDRVRDEAATAETLQLQEEFARDGPKGFDALWLRSGVPRAREWHVEFLRFADSFCRFEGLPFGGVAFDIRGVKIGLARLCSSWAAIESFNADLNRVLIGRPQLEATFRDLRDADVRVAVVHHPPGVLEASDRNALEEYLEREDCPILLHGHTPSPHPADPDTPASESVTSWNDGRLIGFGAGHFDRFFPDELRGPFVLIEIDADRSRLAAYLHRWDGSTERWVEPHSDEIVRLSWLRPPTPEHLASLPRWASVAFGARLVRRARSVLPSVAGFDANDLEDALDQAIQIAERAAARNSPISIFDPTRIQIEKVREARLLDLERERVRPGKLVEGSGLARQLDLLRAAEAVLDLAAPAIPMPEFVLPTPRRKQVAAAFLPPRDSPELRYAPLRFAVQAILAPHIDRFAEACACDFLVLRRLARRNGWTDATPVDVASPGPLWPEGAPAEPPPLARPSRWVLVAGLSFGAIHDDAWSAAERLGQALAEAGYGLISGGRRGVDQIVARNHGDVLRRAGHAADDWLIQVFTADIDPRYGGGRHIVVANEKEWSERAVAIADAAVLISGVGGPESIGKQALAVRTPVLPLAATGGDAQKLFNRIVALWDQHSIDGLTLGEFLRLDAGVPEVIDVVMDLLGRLFAIPDRPDAQEAKRRSRHTGVTPGKQPAVPPGMGDQLPTPRRGLGRFLVRWLNRLIPIYSTSPTDRTDEE